MKQDTGGWRNKILDAAEIEFTLRGIDSTPELIAERAGVDDETFHRIFQDKQALLDALLDRFLIHMETVALSDSNDFSAFEFIEQIAHNYVTSPVLSEYFHSAVSENKTVYLARERFIQIAEKCLNCGAQKDMLRHDLVTEDFTLIFSMLWAILYGRNLKERKVIRERVLSFLYTGLLSNR